MSNVYLTIKPVFTLFATIVNTTWSRIYDTGVIIFASYPLLINLLEEYGGVTATLVRNSSQYGIDNENVLRQIPAGVPVFDGMRPVTNWLLYNNDITNTNPGFWDPTSATVNSFESLTLLASGNANLRQYRPIATLGIGIPPSIVVVTEVQGTAGDKIRLACGTPVDLSYSGDLTLTGGIDILSHSCTGITTGSSLEFRIYNALTQPTEKTLLVKNSRLFITTGQVDITKPAEAINTTTAPTTQWFDYENPFTVDPITGVVTEGAHVPLTTGRNGMLFEPLSTNKCLCNGIVPDDEELAPLISGVMTKGKVYKIKVQSSTTSFVADGAPSPHAIGDTFVAVGDSVTLTVFDSVAEIVNAVGTKSFHDGVSFVNNIQGMILSGDVTSTLSIENILPWGVVGIGDSFADTPIVDWPGQLGVNPGFVVVGKGVAGDTLAMIEARFVADVLPLEPDWVVIQGGVNSVIAGSTSAEMMTSVENMISIALAAGIQIALINISPFGNSPNWTTARQTVLEEYNALLAAYATTNNYPITDIYTSLGDGINLHATYDSGDGLHPNASGMTLIASGISASIPPRTDVNFLSALLNQFKLYKITNTNGPVGSAYVTFGGTVGNTNGHSMSCFMLADIETGGVMSLNDAFGTVTSSKLSFTRLISENAIPTQTYRAMRVYALSNKDVYFLAPQLEELPFATGPIPSTAGATGTRLATILSVPTPTYTSGVWHEKIEWTPRAVAVGRVETLLDQMFDVNNGLRLISDGSAIYFEKMVAGVSERASLTMLPVKDTTYVIDPRMLADNTLSLFVDGTPEDTNTSTTSVVTIGTTTYIGSDGVNSCFANIQNVLIDNKGA